MSDQAIVRDPEVGESERVQSIRTIAIQALTKGDIMSDPRSEFRIDNTISPSAPLLPAQLFVEISGKIRLSDLAAERIGRDFGKPLSHLPPNPWTPLTQSSFRELQSVATWSGGIDLANLGFPSVHRVSWRLQWLDRKGPERFAVLRCGEIIDMKSRPEAAEIMMKLQASFGIGKRLPTCEASIELPGDSSDAFEAQIERIADALDLTSLDDDSGDTRGLMRQRHMYGATPAVIELWSAGEYSGRTWILLERDIIDRFGSLDLLAVQELIQPDITEGLRAMAKCWNGVVIVNEQ